MQRSILEIPDDEPIEDSAVAADGAPTGGAQRHHHVSWLAWLVVSTIVVMVGAGLGVISEIKADRHADSVAAIPGFLRPLEHEPGMSWHLDRTSSSQVVAASGLLDVLDGGTGTWQLTAHDPSSGDPVWTTRLGTAAASGFQGGMATCPSGGPDLGATILCAVSTPVAIYPGAVAIPTTDVVAIDAKTGTITGRWTVPDQVTAVARTGNDVIVSTITSTQVESVSRRVGATGDVVWHMDAASTTHLAYPGAGSGITGLVRVTISVTSGLAAVAGRDVLIFGIDDGSLRWNGPGLSTSAVRLAVNGFSTWQINSGGNERDRKSVV